MHVLDRPQLPARAAEIYDYHQSVVKAERAAINDEFEDFTNLADGLNLTQNTLRSIKSGLLNRPSRSRPRPSLALFHKVFEETSSQVKSSLEPAALKFMGQVIAPLWEGIFDDANTIEATLDTLRSNACPTAEPRFNDCLLKIKAGVEPDPKQLFINIMHDSDGSPIALQKALTPSVLTLVPIKFIASQSTNRQIDADDFFIPSGTIGSITGTKKEQTSTRQIEGTTVATYVTTGNLHFRPSRLSAWAFESALDRSTFALEGYGKTKVGFDSTRADMLETTTLKDFRQSLAQLIAT
jgi:hypothetical protein